MKHKLLIAAAASALLVPAVAAAQDGSGFYVKGQLGYGVVNDTEFDSPTVGASSTIMGDVEGEGNAAFILGFGIDFDNNWRLEIEGMQMFNDLGAVDNNPNTRASIRTKAAMLNAIYDFDDFGRWEPYVGAGIGLVEGDVSAAVNDFPAPSGAFIVRHPNCTSVPAAANVARSCNLNDEDTSFGWQVLAGLGYNITDNLTWDTSYKYVDASNFDVKGDYNAVTTGGVVGTADTASILRDVTQHVVMTGFRYRFGSPTPPPPPPPPPPPETFTCWDGVTEVTDLALCPPELVTCWDGVTEVTDLSLCPPELVTCPDGVTRVSDLAACPVIQVSLCEPQFRQEIIYYEFDRGQSAETRNTINRLLDIGQYCQVDNIRVVGHTDTSGPQAYNMRLSNRRAEDARSELIRQGVGEGMITSEGKGETEPFVNTGDGVREQLNRRTEVLMTISEVSGVVN